MLGALVVTLLLAYLLWPRGSAESSVELVPADQRPAGASAPPAASMQVQPLAPPMPVVTAPPAPAAPAAGAVPEGLRLTGVAGGGAIFAFADGSQRYVRRGRDVVPGVTLQNVALRHVVIGGPAGTYRLGFGGAAVALAPPSPAPLAVAGPAPQMVVPGAGRNAMGGPMVSEAQQQQLGRQLIAGLEPRVQGRNVTGWTIRPGANLPPLAQAGLQPGDVLISVNGEAVLDAEQVAGLSQQIVNSRRAEFEFERNGQRMRRSLEVNSGR